MPEGIVSIVIPAWNAAPRIGEAVRAARSQSELSHAPEVVVVDDGSSDGTADAAASAGARVVRQENRGPAAARNAGWRASTGESVLFTDSDCLACADWASRLLVLLDEPGVGAAGGSYDMANRGSLLASCIQEEIALRHRGMRREVRFLGSFNLAVPRRVLEEVGGFDPAYRRASGEDNDLSYRIRKRGYRLLFDREARVRHEHPEKLGRYLAEQARHGYWRMKLYRDHPERMRGDDYSGPLDFVEPPAAALFLLALPFVRIPAARWAAAGLFLVLLLAALVPATRIARAAGARHLYFVPVRVVRSFARAAGMAAGIATFWIAAPPAKERP